ncbi:MAG TPA: DNA polymerase Y family protein, partial [Sphingopyxis sp.]|nr:DNA polymerase Y family protein [Sphingopyxis sp.]
MTRVASLFLPQLAIERLRQAAPISRSGTRPEPAPLAPRLPEPVDDNPGACSVPRGGGWRPGARWAQDARPDRTAIDALPAHQRPPMRELGRRSEAAAPVFRLARVDDGSPASGAAQRAPARWGTRPTILIARTGQRDIVTAACPLALDLGLAPGMAAAHARALVTDLDVLEAEPDADRAWLDRLALHAVCHWTPTAAVSGSDGLWLDLTGTTH